MYEQPSIVRNSSGSTAFLFPAIRFRAELPSFAVIGGSVIAAYSTAITSTYAFSDDYFNLHLATVSNNQLFRNTLSSGRPLSGFLQQVGMSLATDVSSLRWLRLVGLLALTLLGFFLYGVFRESSLGRAGAAAAAIVALTMPAYQVAASWTILFPVAFGGVLGTYGGYLVASSTPDARARLMVVGGLSLFLALAFYQPIAMLYWVGGAMIVFGLHDELRSQLRILVRLGVVFSVAMLAHFGMLRLLVAVTGASANSRVALVTDVTEKAGWFINAVVAQSFDPFAFLPRTIVVVALTIALGFGLLLRGNRPIGQRVVSVLLVFLILPAAYTPNLLIAENWASYRTGMAIEVATVAIAVLAIQGFASRLPRRSVSLWRMTLIVSIVVSVVGFAAWRVDNFFTQPQETEYRLVRQAILSANVKEGEPLYLILASWTDYIAPDVALDEFGIPSTAVPWVPSALATIEFMNEGRAVPDIYVIAPDGADQVPDGSAVVDFRDLLDQVAWQVDEPEP